MFRKLHDGLGLISETLTMVKTNGGLVMRIAAVLLLILIGLDCLAWITFDTNVGVGVDFLALAAFMVVPVWIAVSWHRGVLLRERPKGLVPDWRGQIFFNYWVAGMLLGILCLLGALLVFLAAFVLLGDAAEHLFHRPLFLSFFMTSPLVSVFLGATMILPTWLVLRLSPMLPHVAVTGEWIGLKAAWRQSRSMGWRLFTVAIIAGFAYMVVDWLTWRLEDFEASLPATIAAIVLSDLVFALQIILGAAIFTVIYDRTRSGPEAEI